MLSPLPQHDPDDDEVDIMKDYMLRMGRTLNGIKDQSKVCVNPEQTKFKYNFKPKNGKSPEGVLPMFF